MYASERGERALSRGNNNNKPVLPVYTIAAIWLMYSFFFPIFSIARLVWVASLAALGYHFVKSIIGDKAKKPEQTAQPVEPVKPAAAPAEEKPKYAPEVQAIVDEGKKAHDELERLYFSIPDLAVKRKVKELMEVSDKIVQDAIDDPSDVPQIKKFLDYYLPTTIKLLNAYDRMGAQGIEGENIGKTMSSINEMLDTAIDAYKKLLDSLFANQAMDIETDIDVMNTLLRREGFSAAGEGGMKF